MVSQLHCPHTILSSSHPDIPHSFLLSSSETLAVIHLISQMALDGLCHGHQLLSFQDFYICFKAKVAFTIISSQETSDSFLPNDTLISTRTLEYITERSSYLCPHTLCNSHTIQVVALASWSQGQQGSSFLSTASSSLLLQVKKRSTWHLQSMFLSLQHHGGREPWHFSPLASHNCSSFTVASSVSYWYHTALISYFKTAPRLNGYYQENKR